MTDFIDAVWAHEGFGRGSGTGHESLARAEAGKENNNPYYGIEAFIEADSATLAARVRTEVGAMSDRINAFTADEPAGPEGNLAASGWLWYWELFNNVLQWRGHIWTVGGF